MSKSKDLEEIVEKFISALPPHGKAPVDGDPAALDVAAATGSSLADYRRFRATHGQTTFGGGLLRFVAQAGLPSEDLNGARGWQIVWPERRFVAFAYDWLGRVYAFDPRRTDTGEPLVTLLDPTDGAVMESGFSFRGFLEWLAGADGVGGLSKPLFEGWRASGGSSPGVRQCVSFKHPVVLGGSQTVANLELCDLEVFMAMMGQIVTQVARSKL